MSLPGIKTLAIIGGGAAGLAAAIAASERANALGQKLDVTVYERDDRVGRSILATGNGRCNFSNANPYADDYHGADFVGEAVRNATFSYMQDEKRAGKILEDCGHVVNVFFYEHGLRWRTEEDGRQYPLTNKASTVVDILRASAKHTGVKEACEHEVAAVDAPRSERDPFTLRLSDKRLIRSDAVIVAAGGRAIEPLAPSCIPRVPRRPVLGPLRCAETNLTRELDNIRVRCKVSLLRSGSDGLALVASETGELMFRKYGVSGICVFNLSRFAESGDTLEINLLHCNSLDDAKDFLFRRRKLLAQTFGNDLTFETMLRGIILPRIADVILKRINRSSNQPFNKSDVPVLAEALAAFPLRVTGMGDESICQVHRGGLDVAAFNPRTMESFEVPGLFAAGEALDVDGPCGGYNLHWAWSSGMLAGIAAADKLCNA